VEWSGDVVGSQFSEVIKKVVIPTFQGWPQSFPWSNFFSAILNIVSYPLSQTHVDIGVFL